MAAEEKEEVSKKSTTVEKWKKKDVSSVLLWYYRDNDKKRQGPFWPGQMRQWFEAGYLPPNQLIAPSFKGEVPREYIALSELFPCHADKNSKAFLARADIPAFPIALSTRSNLPTDGSNLPADDVSTKQTAPSKRPQWLEDSIERQRLGIKRQKLSDTSVSDKDLFT